MIARWLPNLGCLWIGSFLLTADSNNVDEEGAYQLSRGIGEVVDLSISRTLSKLRRQQNR